jgi:hypothetical protein
MSDPAQFDVPAIPLVMRNPRPVELNGVDVCQLVELVLVAELGLRAACTAGGVGRVSIFSDFRSPDALFALARSAIEGAGATVDIRDGVVVVTGETREDSAGFSAPPPAGLPDVGPETVAAPPAGFSVPLSALDANDVARGLVTIDGAVSRFVQANAEAVSFLVEDLGLDAVAVAVGSRTLVVGASDVVATISGMFAASDVDVHTVPSDVSPEMAEALAAEFGVRIVPGRDGYLTVAGAGEGLTGFLQAVHRLGLRSSQRAVSAAFVFGSERQLRSLSLSLGGGLNVGDLVVNVGQAAEFAAFVDGIAQASGVRIAEQPSVSVRDGVPAVFLSGREVPVQTEVDAEGTASVEYRSTGTRLTVLTSPRPGGLVDVEVSVEVSSVDGAGVLANPTFSTRALQTSVVARPGDVLVLSGFSSVRTERQNRGSLLGLGGLRDREDVSLAVLLVVE